MFSVEALRQLFSVEALLAVNTGVFILLVIRIWNGSPAMFAQWIAYRRAKAEEKTAEYSRLRNENKRIDDRCIKLEERVDSVEEAERRCRAELVEKERRIANLEGLQQGRGEARQELTILESAKRLGDDKSE